MRLLVHDLLTLAEGQAIQDKYDQVIPFAKAIEELGYYRYWFSEHHGTDMVASSVPELLVAYIAAVTKNIRLGTGGTMIQHYSPLRVAEVFKTLALLAHGRIDLGIGRAPGDDQFATFALGEGRPIEFDELYDKSQIILDYIGDKETPGFYGLTKAMPQNIPQLPQAWMLGSSGQSVKKAGQMGLGYSFAKFFGVPTNSNVFKAYRDSFKPSSYFEKPEIMVSYQILVADNEEDLERIVKPAEYMAVKGPTSRIPCFESVKDLRFSSREQAIIDARYQNRFTIKGTKDQVAAILAEEIEAIGMDEIMMYSPIYDYSARLRSYALLAEIFA